MAVGGISAEMLKQYIERIERLEQEKKEVSDHIKDIFAEAKSQGFEPKIMKQVIRARKMERSELEEEDALLETYKKAVGLMD